MNANTSWLDDPQFANRRLNLGESEEIPKTIQQRLWADPSPQFKDHQPGASLRWKSENLTEIVIESDEDSIFAGANTENRFVRRSREILVSHCHHIVTRHRQKVGASPTDVFIQLDLHSRDVTERERQNSFA
jgi:hypothetical protein